MLREIFDSRLSREVLDRSSMLWQLLRDGFISLSDLDNALSLTEEGLLALNEADFS